MKLITTKTHGVLDYVVGFIIAASPWLFNYVKMGQETLVPVVMGAAAVLYSLLTNYEFGAIKVIQMRVHLVLDFANGVILAASPWIFGFSDVVYLPHLILGISEIAVVLMTEPKPRGKNAPIKKTTEME